jgi:hypothetical protein
VLRPPCCQPGPIHPRCCAERVDHHSAARRRRDDDKWKWATAAPATECWGALQ